MADNSNDLMVATTSFAAGVNGVQHQVFAGKTRVRRSDPLFFARPEAWEAINTSPTIESATAAPGEKRGVA